MKIACVIVTYNRKNELIHTIDSIMNQTIKVQEIFIIDNASSDGTEQYLIDKNYLNNKNITYRKMNDNLGGAGGFNIGIQSAFEKGYDWIWVMDDDGRPNEYCLENLLKYKDKSEFLAPLVLNIDNSKELSFKYKKIELLDELLKNNKNKEFIENFACPFNGILLSRCLIERIGFPKKDMFIWGDEQEFYHRVKKEGVIPLTIISAIHYHPKDRLQPVKIMGGKKSILYPEGELRQYCVFRNYTYINKKYYGVKGLIKRLGIYTYFFIVEKKCDYRGLLFFLRAYVDGVKEDFTKHKTYMK